MSVHLWPIDRAAWAALLALVSSATAYSQPAGSAGSAKSTPPALQELHIVSSLDTTEQPSLLWVPPEAAQRPVPLLVYLHSWSGDYRQDNAAWFDEAVRRGWLYLHPNFRGVNNHPPACGSQLARQDILDAVDFVRRKYHVNGERIYLAGSSGGGHMSLLMAGHFPEKFSAVSAWVGITDLADWYRFHTVGGKQGNYARMIANSLGGPPGHSAEVDSQYRERSPLFHLHRATQLPLDIAAGVHDGHTGSVPIFHSLRAFNVVSQAGGHPAIAEEEMNQLWNQGRLERPLASDQVDDPSYGRKILLRRHAGPVRITIFEGGHEGLARAGCEWLAEQRRMTK
jgi:pimeloyl-ACP methyl ester carboxylesterase